MELTWIDDFLALEQARNFTRAAAMRYTTQSAYSRRIARLEDWMGAPLFNREDRPVTLTAQGAEFLPRAQKLRTDILDTRRAVRVLGSHFDRPVRIYTTSTLAAGFFPQWVASQNMPHYSLVVASLTGCLESVLAGRCDQAMVPMFQNLVIPGQIHVSEIGSDTLTLRARADIAARISVVQKKLKGPLMVYTPGTLFDTPIAEVLHSRKISIADVPVCESASAEALVAQARGGLGAAWIPDSTATPDLVACVPEARLQIPFKIGVLRRLAGEEAESTA